MFYFLEHFFGIKLSKLTLALAARCHSWAASAAVAGSHVPYGKVPSHSVTDHQGVLAGNTACEPLEVHIPKFSVATMWP